MTTIAAFALLSLIITVTPGPDSLLVLRSSLRAGRGAPGSGWRPGRPAGHCSGGG
jgi:threonine/homoserine/homoserine lactone efflux protein